MKFERPNEQSQNPTYYPLEALTSGNGFVISERDKSIVRKGLEALREKYFESRTAETLPDLIVFPETSARPLYYATKPLIDQVYGEKQAAPPESAFYLVNAHRENKSHRRLKSSLDLMAEDEEADRDQDTIQSFQKWYLENKEVYEQGHVVNLERAREILEKSGARRILIIDDVSLMDDSDVEQGMAGGSTLEEMRTCFLEIDPNVSVDAFAFITPEEVTRMPWFYHSEPIEPADDAPLNFDYRDQRERTQDGSTKSEIMGVEKPAGTEEFQKHVVRSRVADAEELRELRKQMREIGKE